MNIFLQDFKGLSESGQVEAYKFTPQNEEQAAILCQQLSHVTVPPSQSTGIIQMENSLSWLARNARNLAEHFYALDLYLDKLPIEICALMEPFFYDILRNAIFYIASC